MGAEFTPVFLFVFVGLLTGIGMVVASQLLGPRKTTAVKQMPYESGMDPIGDARQRFDVRYYLVAIVFLLFDVELLYLYPWAVAQWSAGPAGAARGEAAPGLAAPGPASPVADVAPMGGYGIPPVFRMMVLIEILLFVAVLAAAFAYAWRKEVFTWR